MAKFATGTSGNPSGRRHGSRNRASLLCDKLAADDIGDVMHAVLRKARDGDADCAKLILSRCWPARRARVHFVLPELRGVGDLPNAIAAIMRQVADGTLAPSEAGEIAALLSAQRQAFELAEIEERLRQIEGKFGR